MMTQELTLRYANAAVRPAAAWFIPGDAPTVWLDEMAKAGAASSSTKLYVLSASTGERRPIGVLIVPADARIAPSSRWHAYGLTAKRFYLPVDGELYPEIEDDELQSLLVADVEAYVFHPIAGLTAFEANAVLRPADLLSVSPCRPSSWGRATPGFGYARRLRSVEPQESFDLAAVVEDMRDDIGREAPTLERLPKSPKEPTGEFLDKIAGAALTALASLIAPLTNLAPRTARAPTWVNALENWAQGVLQRRSERLDAERHREIFRLMHLLETNPDEGLRFALPLAGDPARGVAPPSNRLGRREVDFQSGRAGGEADYWELRGVDREKLLRRYRELANREIQLGRHRRAAYIFAELLGDFPAAAGWLEQGGHFREAATLYRERLNNRRDAARCLERGGLFQEALQLYIELEDWETAGDLHRRLGESDEAKAAYHRAVELRRAQGDRLAAARLLEEKLEDPDQAIEELAGGWPASQQSQACLRGLFEALARHHRHEDARQRVQAKPSDLTQDQWLIYVYEMTRLALEYPHREVNALAADRARLAVAARLDLSTEPERRRLLSAFERLVPSDRLLARDCHRYLEQSAQRARIATLIKRTKPTNQCSLVRQFRLPDGVEWKSAIPIDDYFVAAGYRDQEVVLVRANWKGKVQRPADRPWRTPILTVDGLPRRILLAKHWLARNFVIAYVPSTENVDFDIASDNDFRTYLKVRSNPAVSSTSEAITTRPDGLLWSLTWENDELTLSSWQASAQPTSSQLLRVRVKPESCALHAGRERVYVAVDRQLHSVATDGTKTTQELPSLIHSLVGSAPHSQQRVAAMMEEGAAMIWDDHSGAPPELFARDLHRPVGTFTPHGWFVAASQQRCEVYRTQSHKLVYKASAPGGSSQPIAVLPADHADQFAVVDETGGVSIFKIPMAS